MASINVTGIGAPLTFLVGGVVNVEAIPAGAVSYLWEMLDAPEGSVAAFALPTTQITTFSIDLEGTYFFQVTVELANGVIEVARAVAAAPFITTEGLIRIPAAGETFEADGLKGWSRAVQAALRLSVAAFNLATSAVTGRTWKDPVLAAANVNIPLTGATPLVVDTETIPHLESTLLRGQTLPAQNGIYLNTVTGGTYTLSRRPDADVASELVGAVVGVLKGATDADKAFMQLVDDIVLDATSLFWGEIGTFVPGVAVPIGTSATLVDVSPTRKILRWNIGTDVFEVELGQV